MAQGAKAAASVAEACRGDAVITMLANHEAVESVVLDAMVSSPVALSSWRPVFEGGAHRIGYSSAELARERAMAAAMRSRAPCCSPRLWVICSPFALPSRTAFRGSLAVSAGAALAALRKA